MKSYIIFDKITKQITVYTLYSTFQGKIEKDCNGYYFAITGAINSYIFYKAGYCRPQYKNIFIKILHYYDDRGEFPYCKTEKDVLKILNYMKDIRFIDIRRSCRT